MGRLSGYFRAHRSIHPSGRVGTTHAAARCRQPPRTVCWPRSALLRPRRSRVRGIGRSGPAALWRRVVGRNRVLRLMGENQLLSPYRRPPRPANGSGAPTPARCRPVADGRVWVSAGLDHLNSEIIGHYVSTDGGRFAPLEDAKMVAVALALERWRRQALIGDPAKFKLKSSTHR
jgi:hypothetical protein